MPACWRGPWRACDGPWRGGISVLPVEAREAAEDIRLDSNIVAGFVADCVTFDPAAMVSTGDFAAAFVSWWMEHKGEDRGAPSGDRIAKSLRGR